MTAEVLRLVDELRAPAAEASRRAHAPFSRLQVGAAVRGTDGRVHVGCNVESESYGLTQCAERNALGAAIAAGAPAGTLMELVVYVPGEHAVSPCGACRQVIVELMAPDARVVSCCDGAHHIAWTLAQLLPQAFRLD